MVAQDHLTFRLRTNMAVAHLLGAAQFAREMAVIENDNKDEPLGAFYDSLRARASAAVMMSVASIECYANELFVDASQYFEPTVQRLWLRAAEDIDRKSILDKCDWFLCFRGEPVLERGRSPTQNIRCLVELRNELVHFRPEWQDEAKRHASISKALKTKFPPLKWLSGDPGIFPRAWTSHACASWAVNSCVTFLDLFAARANLKTPLDGFRQYLGT